MPIGNPTVIAASAAAIGLAVPMIDAAGPAATATVLTAICSWIVANGKVDGLKLNPPAAPTPTWSCAVGSLIGNGNIHFTASDEDLAAAIITAVPIIDLPGQDKWKKLAKVLYDYLVDHGQPSGTNLTYPTPAGGPVIGVATILHFDLPVTPGFFSLPMGITDVKAAAAVDVLGGGIVNHITTNWQIGTAPGAPTGLVGADGAPPTGFALIS